MRFTKYLVVSAAAFAAFCIAPKSQAQMESSRTETTTTTTRSAPSCTYGYYAYKPYHCAPRGYYGPEWFQNGTFVGAGPYYKGDANFHGYVNEQYDEHHGYHGPYPTHTETYSEYKDGEFTGKTYYTPRGTTWSESTTTTTTSH